MSTAMVQMAGLAARGVTRISATGTWTDHFSMIVRGFTLVELLVVLLIIGLVTSFTLVMMNRDSLEYIAEKEIRRTAALLELAAEQAVLEGSEYGVGFTETGYRFYRYTDNNWTMIGDDRLLRPRTLEPGLVLALYIENENIQLVDTGKKGSSPQLMLFSSGERTPFELIIKSPASSRGPSLNGQFYGRLEIVVPESS